MVKSRRAEIWNKCPTLTTTQKDNTTQNCISTRVARNKELLENWGQEFLMPQNRDPKQRGKNGKFPIRDRELTKIELKTNSKNFLLEIPKNKTPKLPTL